jgi:hypothetical protein
VEETETWRGLAAKIKKTQPGVVIVDPVALAVETTNENDNSEQSKIAKRFIDLVKGTSTGLVLVHHTSQSGAKSADQYSARGATSLTNNSRCAWQLTRTEDGLGVLCSNVKQSYGPRLPQVMLERLPGGVLAEVSAVGCSPAELADPVLAWFEDHSGETCLYDVQQHRGKAKPLFESIKADYRAASDGVIVATVKMLLKDGVLLEVERVKEYANRSKRTQLVLEVAPETAENREDEVPF